LIKKVLVETRCVERIPPPPVRQCQPGGGPEIAPLDVGPAVPGRVGDRGPGDHDVGPHPVHLERSAHLGDLEELIITEPDGVQQFASGDDPLPEGLLPLGVRGQEGLGIPVEGQPATEPPRSGAADRAARRSRP
jgi:hypothetical protein